MWERGNRTCIVDIKRCRIRDVDRQKTLEDINAIISMVVVCSVIDFR